MDLKAKAYDILKERIINGRYAPGEMLNEKQIIEEINVSRTPFREAINALSKENLVNIYPRRGMFVSEITIKDIADLYTVREELESFAVKLAIPNIPKDTLLILKNKLEIYIAKNYEANYDEIVKEDEGLHNLILKYAGNIFLSRMMENIYQHNQRIRVLSTRSTEDVLETLKQHMVILEAMLDGNEEKAAQEMKNHIVSSRERAFEHILKNGKVSLK